MEAERKFDGNADLYRTFSARPALTAIESIALDRLKQIAAEGQQASQQALAEACNAAHPTGTVPGVLNRLERKGYIIRQYYQRGLQVTITETGQTTAPPPCTAPHWRNRVDRTPTPAIQAIRQRDISTAMQIENEARALGKSVAEFLADLVYIGWHALMAEREQA